MITLNKTDDVLADVYRVEMNLSCTSFLHGACFSMRMILMIIIAIAIMMQETETSGEPDAIAIAAFVAKCNTNAARSMGISASMLEAYILDIGVFVEDNNTCTRNPGNRQQQGHSAAGVHRRHLGGEVGDNIGIASVQKKQKVFERLK